MANLAVQEAEHCSKGSARKADELRSRQEDFLRHHLGLWAPEFARSLKEESPSPYFQFLGDLLETILESGDLEQ